MEDWVPNLRRQRSCAVQSNGINNWLNNRSISTRFGNRCSNENDYGNNTPYYQMGESKKKGWFSKLKKITRRKKKISQTNLNDNPFCDPFSCKQNADWGSDAVPSKLTRSFSVHIANPSANYQRFG